jgi:hypothetical protein
MMYDLAFFENANILLGGNVKFEVGRIFRRREFWMGDKIRRLHHIEFIFVSK